MSRRRRAPKREILPDPKFGSELLAKFINHVMVRGKKSVAEKIVYGALNEVMAKFKTKKVDEVDSDKESDAGSVAINIFKKAIDSISPTVEVRSRRVGGSTYQVPMEVRPSRRLALAMRWLIDAAKSRSEKTMAFRLAGEMMDAMGGRGNAVKKREDTHRMAMANQAFAHYRW